MPVDQWGNRADVIMDGVSVVKRQNVGQLYEQYVNATSAMVTRHLIEFKEKGVPLKVQWDYILGYYKLVSPCMYDVVANAITTPIRQQEHLDEVYKDGIYLWIPTDSPNLGEELIRGLKEHYPLEFGPIKYRGRSGNVVTTKDPIIIASKYMMLLEAIPDNWSSVATAKLQHFGICAKLTNSDKYSSPNREQPVRIAGEAEIRLLIATIGPEAAAEFLDGSNSPATHKAVVRKILSSESPTNITEIVDRTKIPRGNSRSVVYVKHILKCGGIELIDSEYDHNAEGVK